MAEQICLDDHCQRQNLGIPDCVSFMKKMHGFAIVPSSFRVPVNAIYRTTFASGYLSNDPETRIYALPTLQNIMIDGVASTFVENDAGYRYKTRTNPMMVTAEFWEREAQFGLFGQIHNLQCNDWSIIGFDINNQAVGQKFATVDAFGNVTYEWGGIPINSRGTDGLFSFANSAATGKIAIEIQFGQTAKPEDFYIVNGNNLHASVSDSTPVVFDFINPPKIVHCNLNVNGSDSVSATVVVNTIHRQGAITPFDNQGDVIGLDAIARWNWENHSNLSIPTGGPQGVTSSTTGVYDIAIDIADDWDTGDLITLNLTIDSSQAVNYLGSVTFNVEP